MNKYVIKSQTTQNSKATQNLQKKIMAHIHNMNQQNILLAYNSKSSDVSQPARTGAGAVFWIAPRVGSGGSTYVITEAKQDGVPNVDDII